MNNAQKEAWLNRVIEEIYAHGGKVVVKKGWFWKLIHTLVVIVTFGANRNFLKGYYTTIGAVVGCPDGWDSYSLTSRVAVLEHELVHIKQCKKLGFGHVWLGFPLYMVLYLLLPLPIGLAYFRWRFEREAYAHGINVRVKMEPHMLPYLIDKAVKQLTTGAYGWTWPFKARAYAYFFKHCPSPMAHEKAQ